MEPSNREPEEETTYVFGPFRFNPAARSLIRDGLPISLTAKTADLLFAFIQSAGRVITKEELMQRIWPQTFVVEGNLAFYIHRLRKALADTTERPIYIKTVAGRGYRFICPVTIAAADPPALGVDAPVRNATSESSPGMNEADAAPNPWLRRVTVLVGVLAAVIIGTLTIETREGSMPRLVRVKQLTHDGKAKFPQFFVDRSRLLFRIGQSKQYELRLDTGDVVRREPLDGYHLLDISPIRGEALAKRPQDRGAEDALWAVRLDGSSQRRLGMVLADGYAAWSHDGRRIAYGRDHTLYVTDSDGIVVRSLTSFTGSIEMARWGPRDAFVRADVHERMARTSEHAQYDVRLPDGQSTRVVTVPGVQVCCGVWMPDSREYAVVESREAGGDMWVERESGGYFGRRPPEVRQLTSRSNQLGFSYPVPSADDSTLYAIGQHAEQLTTYDASLGAFVPYLNGISAFSVSFSPDRRSVAYITLPDYTLWRAAADGTKSRQLTNAPWHVDAFAWSPDGRRFAIRAMSEPGHHTKIYLQPAEGGVAEPLENADVEQGSPTWSFDGTRIAFGDVPETYGQATGRECLHIYDLASRATTDIPGSIGLWSSRWSPDGRYIAATRIRDRALMLYDISAGQWHDLNLQHVGELTWSLDGSTLFVDPEPPVHWFLRVHVPDGRAEPVVDVADEVLHYGAGVALDGRPLFLRTPTDIYALHLERR